MNTAELKEFQKPSVLIVEDEWIVSLELQEHLKQMGYGVIGSVDEGKHAIAKIVDNTPDVILMDIKLKGDMDGIEASQQIRKNFDIPVIYLTANTDKNTFVRAMSTNPYGYILKPFSSRDLNSAIECALRKAEYEQKMGANYAKIVRELSVLSVGVILINEVGEIYMFNNKASVISEWKEVETIGLNIDSIYKTYKDSDCVDRVINYSHRIINDNRSDTQHLYLKTRNGIVKRVMQMKFYIYSENGNIANSVIAFDEHEIPGDILKEAGTIVNGLKRLFE